MEMNYEALIIGGIGIVIGAWNFYLYSKMKETQALVDDFINNFPKPEEMAREILKVKLPINELPDDVKDKIKNIMGAMPDGEMPSGKIPKLNDKPSYMG